MKIIFTDTVGISEEYKPKPATSSVPEWYKNMLSYMGNQKRPNGKGKTTATIKKCMPVFDAITAGYVLYTYTDIYVSQRIDPVTENNKEPKKYSYFEWPSYEPIKFHPVDQAPNHPKRGDIPENGSYPKLMNPWAIKTPKGYSCLFTQPMHRQSLFTILDGVVDTDTYITPVNFPFVLNDLDFEGFIPAGTPMAQVIPFKRESWKMEIGTEKELKESKTISKSLNSLFFDSYKNKFRQPKEYK